jgi:Icc-related predicted phosphoesterase
MKIVCFSDTHKQHEDVVMPDGDVLVFAGDMCGSGKLKSIIAFNEWLGTLPHKNKIVIAGNHDRSFEGPSRTVARLEMTNAIYLEDEEVVIDGVKFYGSPYQPEFCSWAFNLPRGELLARKWSFIPDDTNVLITHGPPYSILDENNYGELCGCQDLQSRIHELKDLKLHVFGHIHYSYGIQELFGVKYVNACVCGEDYKPDNKPIVVEI